MKILSKCACAALFFFLVSCGNKNTYWYALPEQSAAVASIDLPRMAARSELDGERGEAALNRMKEMVKSGLEGSGQLVDQIFEDASESGIDFKDKIYLFSSEESAVRGLLAKVRSSRKLEKVIHSFTKEQICQPIRETEGCHWTILGKLLLAYSDDALLVLSDNKWSDPSNLVRQASMWLRQEEGQGFAASKDFQQLQATHSDVACWASLQILPRNLITPFTMGLSAELDLKKIKAVTSLNFETGQIVMDIDPIVTDHIVKELGEKKNLSTDTIKGKYLDFFTVKTNFWTTAHIKGKQFYQFLREIPAVRKFFDYSELPITLDYGRIFEAIDGEVSFAITNPVRNKFIFYADVTQNKFLSLFTELRPMIEKTNGMMYFNECGKDAYCIVARDGSIMNLRPGLKVFWMGVKDGRFYFTNDEDLIDLHVLGLSLRDKKWGKRVTGQHFFAVSDWDSMKSFEMMLQISVSFRRNLFYRCKSDWIKFCLLSFCTTTQRICLPSGDSIVI